jgi:hypothetical protein
MMRLTMAVWWSLALVWFVTAQAGAGAANTPVARHIDVKGYGVSIEAARKDALREATARLHAELRQEHVEHWEPNDAVVQRHLLDGAGYADDDVVIDQLGPQKTWVVKLKIPASNVLQNMERQAVRRDLSETRMGAALQVVAALALLLAVIVGGIYADEWTRSRYTNWMRVAGAGVLTAAAVSWWWLR